MPRTAISEPQTPPPSPSPIPIEEGSIGEALAAEHLAIPQASRMRKPQKGNPSVSQVLPPEHHEPVAKKGDHSQHQTLSQAFATVEKDQPSAIPADPPKPIVHDTPDVPLTTNVIERIVPPATGQPRQPQLKQAAISEPQTPPPAAAHAPNVERTIRETPATVHPDMAPASRDSQSQNETPAAVQALPLTTIIERSTRTEAPLHAVPAESPAPVIIERVRPAPEQRPPLQPQPVQTNKKNTPPVQVSIGTIDLHVNPAESPRPQAPRRRRHPQGFDGFRQRRLYSGWEN
jgi:hypothetical protein